MFAEVFSVYGGVRNKPTISKNCMPFALPQHQFEGLFKICSL